MLQKREPPSARAALSGATGEVAGPELSELCLAVQEPLGMWLCNEGRRGQRRPRVAGPAGLDLLGDGSQM